ncbi:MAG: radical SAM protein [Elusimicrobiota bacterium]
MALHPITSACNQRCVFCSAYGRFDEFFNIRSFINELSKDRDSLVVISGGEPFTVGIDNLIYVINYLTKNNKTVELQTNGIMIKDLDREKLKALVLLLNRNGGYFNVNFPSHNKQVDFKITRIKNSFDFRLKGINILHNLGAMIRITHVINKINYRYLSNFAKFVVNNLNFIDWIQFSFTKGIGRAKQNKRIIPEYKRVSPYLLKAFEILEKNNIYFEIDHIPLCFLGRFYERHVDVNKIKNKIKGEYLKEKEKLLTCKGCKFYKICSGPRKDYIEIYEKL